MAKNKRRLRYANAKTFLESFSEADIRKQLAAGEFDKSTRFVRQQDRECFLAARLGISRLLSELGYSLQLPIELSYDPFGKPFLRDSSIHLNWSHSGGVVCWVVDEVPCGIDVELNQEVRFEYPESVFHLPELNWINQSGREHQERFYYLWTAKESVLKLLGTGLSLNPKAIEIKRTPDIDSRWEAILMDFAIDLDTRRDMLSGLKPGKTNNRRTIFGQSVQKRINQHEYVISWSHPYEIPEKEEILELTLK